VSVLSRPFGHGLLSLPLLLDLDQYSYFGTASAWAFTTRGVLTMSEIIKSEAISRRRAFSLIGKVAAFAVAASTSAMTVSDAEAQTAGMVRRQERRTGRHERREDRRTGRADRREERRTGATTGTGTGAATGTTTGAAK
jgi:hypothetical protein